MGTFSVQPPKPPDQQQPQQPQQPQDPSAPSGKPGVFNAQPGKFNMKMLIIAIVVVAALGIIISLAWKN